MLISPVNLDGSLVLLLRFFSYLSLIIKICVNAKLSNLVMKYVCSFMQAVSNGLWVVIEDVDKAPPDVRSILLPLLEGSNSFSTGHGEVYPLISKCRVYALSFHLYF